jgi:hypothetical protein
MNLILKIKIKHKCNFGSLTMMMLLMNLSNYRKSSLKISQYLCDFCIAIMTYCCAFDIY